MNKVDLFNTIRVAFVVTSSCFNGRDFSERWRRDVDVAEGGEPRVASPELRVEGSSSSQKRSSGPLKKKKQRKRVLVVNELSHPLSAGLHVQSDALLVSSCATCPLDLKRTRQSSVNNTAFPVWSHYNLS